MLGDMFLKLGDIKGESKVDVHAGQMELMSWSWGADQSGSTRGISVSRPAR